MHVRATLLYTRNDQNVDTSEKIKCNTPVHHKRITYNFYGQTGDKVYIYVSPTKNTQSQVSDLEIHACYTPEVATTIAPTPLTTTPEPITCYFSCDAGSTCVHAEELCDGKCNCYDCRDEENCTTTTPADVCGGFGYEPVICGGAAGATCPRPSDRCTYFPGADFGPCCRANEYKTDDLRLVLEETTTTTKFETTTPAQNGTVQCVESDLHIHETRYRLCNQPPPGPGGAMCAGDATGRRLN
ncbi:hypothetical protein DPMN_105646 [Dreissena polymorpha]|uniref:Uncharacterized protein n=1 Tax=Dreissena polymorpha TaxID=45954 RepID=A0A9D4K3K6_DREPO|nr:hypothetical protein DPMN_105646 [Dreissena polymorpha]